MATCTITVVPPPPPPPVEKKYILELTELEAGALRRVLGSQAANAQSPSGQAVSSVFSALYQTGVQPQGRLVLDQTVYKLFD